MSYILDALKKSEQERQQQAPGEAGTNSLVGAGWVATSSEPLSSTSAQSSALLPGLLLGLLVALLIVAGIWFMQSDDGPALQPQATESQPSIAQPLINPVSEAQASRTEALTLKTEVVMPKTQAQTPESQVVDTTKPVLVEAAEDSSFDEQPADVNLVESNPNVTRSQRTLPPLSVLRTVPDLIITGHIYSSMPEKRSVSMNGHEWSEGEVISGNLYLKEITPDGIVVEVDGWNLPVKRNKGWQAIQ